MLLDPARLSCDLITHFPDCEVEGGVCKYSRVLTSLYWQALFMDQCAQGNTKNLSAVTAPVELALFSALGWHNGSAGREHSRGLKAAAALVVMMPARLQWLSMALQHRHINCLYCVKNTT